MAHGTIAGIGQIEARQTTSIELFEAQLAHKGRTRNACLEGSQFQMLGDEMENEVDFVSCGTRTVIPDLDVIDGRWPFDEDEYYNS